VVIGAVLLVVALAYLVSLPQNQFQPADLLEPKYAADADLGYWMVYEYDQEVDVYHHPRGDAAPERHVREWLDGDGIWFPGAPSMGRLTRSGRSTGGKRTLIR